MMEGIEATGRRDTDDVRVEASQEAIDDARDKALEARLHDNRHPLSNAEHQAISRERIEIRQRRETRAYAATKRGGDHGGGSGGDHGASPPPQVGVGSLGLAALMAAVQSGVLFTTSAAPTPAPSQPPQGPPIVPLDRMRSGAELDAAIAREQAFLASPFAQLVSVDERKTHAKYLADLEGAARVVHTPTNAAKPETPETIMAEIDRLRGVLAKPHDAIVDAPVRARIAELEAQWVAASKSKGLAPAPRGIDPETATDDTLKTEMTWLAGGGAAPMHVQMTQGADAYRRRLQEEALLRKPGGLEILLRIHADDPVAQKRLVTHALHRVGGDATSRPGDDVPSLLARYYDAIAAQARAGNAAVRAMPMMGHDGLHFANADDEERYVAAQRIVAMNPGTTFGSVAAAYSAMTGGSLDQIRAAGQAGNGLEGGLSIAATLRDGEARGGVHFDTTQKPQVGLVQPNGARTPVPTVNGARTPAPPVGVNGTGAKIPSSPPLVVPPGTRLPVATRDGNMTIVVPRAAPAPPRPALTTTSGVDVHAPPRAEPPAAVAQFANARTLANTCVGRTLDPKALPPGYTTYRMGDGQLGIRRKPGNVQDRSFAPLHVDDRGLVQFGEKRVPDNRIIPKGTSLQDAHAFMTSDEVPSFRAYSRMLVDNGIATEAEIQAALAKNGFEGRSVNDVRHGLKEAFRERVMTRMTLRDGDTKALDEARARYADLPWSTRPEAAKAEARQREMMRLTTGLNSSDIGSLAEEWYCEISGLKGAATHVKVDRAGLAKQGITLNEERHLDVVHGQTIYEVKHVHGPLDTRQLEQFDDLRKFGNAGGLVDIGGGRMVREVRYSFVNPEGVRANERWMKQALQENDRLSFEIFNTRGERATITRETLKANPNAIRGWLER